MNVRWARITCALLLLAAACDAKKEDAKPKELPPALSAVASVIASTGPPIMSAAPLASAPPKVPDAMRESSSLVAGSFAETPLSPAPCVSRKSL